MDAEGRVTQISYDTSWDEKVENHGSLATFTHIHPSFSFSRGSTVGYHYNVTETSDASVISLVIKLSLGTHFSSFNFSPHLPHNVSLSIP